MPTKDGDDATRTTVGGVDRASSSHEVFSEREPQDMDSQTLNAVISAAHSLYTADGTSNIGRIWMDALASNGRDQRLGHSGRDASTESLEERAAQLEGIISTLTLMQRTAMEARKTIQLEIYSRVGIGKLPNEVLLRILSYDTSVKYFGDQEYRWHLRQMSRVCSRFRNIVNSYARFWTKISNNFHPEEVTMYLSRSKAAPLSVSLSHSDRRPRDSVAFLDKVIPHCRRWHSLKINYGYFDREYGSEKVHRRLDGLTLPMLESFEIHLPAVEEQGEIVLQTFDVTKFHPYINWEAPMLRRLDGFDVLPKAGTSFRLTQCRLRIGLWHWRCPTDPLEDFMAFLSGQPTLTSLDMTVAYFPKKTMYPVGVPVEMPALERLSFTVECEPERAEHVTAVGVVPSILQSLKIPKLERLYLDFTIDENFELEKIFPKFNDYATLKMLHLETSSEDAGYEIDLCLSPFKTIFERMCNLEDLTIGALDTEVLGTVPDITTPPPLRSLCIKNSPHISDGSLRTVLQHLACGPYWDRFENFTITNCAELSESGELLSQILSQ